MTWHAWRETRIKKDKRYQSYREYHTAQVSRAGLDSRFDLSHLRDVGLTYQAWGPSLTTARNHKPF
eukprot:scaffold2645_cov96-Skeletonema_dohrnii-CCMP3373.AAC.16